MKYIHVEPDTILDRFAGDKKLLRATFEIFRNSCKEYLADIKRSLDIKDALMLGASAHTFKGSVSLFSSGPLYKDAFDLEKMAKEDDIKWENALNLYDHIVSTLPELSEEVTQVMGPRKQSAA